MAIAFDASSTGNYSNTRPWTQSHTVTGSNMVLLVWLDADSNWNGNGATITYNGDSLTKIIGPSGSVSGIQSAVWILIAPATGTHNIVFENPFTPTTGSLMAASYSGVDQVTGFESGRSNQFTSLNTVSQSIVPTGANSMLVTGIMAYGGASAMVASGSQVVKVNNFAASFSLQGLSQLPEATAGTYSVGWSWTGGSGVSHMMSLALIQAATSQILKVSSVAQASIGKISGVSNANIKKVSGVLNQ